MNKKRLIIVGPNNCIYANSPIISFSVSRNGILQAYLLHKYKYLYSYE